MRNHLRFRRWPALHGSPFGPTVDSHDDKFVTFLEPTFEDAKPAPKPPEMTVNSGRPANILQPTNNYV
jgi:hypothetical protein